MRIGGNKEKRERTAALPLPLNAPPTQRAEPLNGHVLREYPDALPAGLAHARAQHARISKEENAVIRCKIRLYT